MIDDAAKREARLERKRAEARGIEKTREYLGTPAPLAMSPYGATKRPRLANRRNKVGASGCSPSSLRECPTLCASSYLRPLAG